MCVRVCVYSCVGAWVRACVRACVLGQLRGLLGDARRNARRRRAAEHSKRLLHAWLQCLGAGISLECSSASNRALCIISVNVKL